MDALDPAALLKGWGDSAQRIQSMHYEAAAGLQRAHYGIGVPLVVLSAAVGTSVIIGSQDDGVLGHLIGEVVVGVMSLFVSVLAGIQTFLRHTERSGSHQIAGVRYGALKREIKHKLAYLPADPAELQEFTDDIRKRWDHLAEESPPIPQRIWKRFTKDGPQKHKGERPGALPQP